MRLDVVDKCVDEIFHAQLQVAENNPQVEEGLKEIPKLPLLLLPLSSLLSLKFYHFL